MTQKAAKPNRLATAAPDALFQTGLGELQGGRPAAAVDLFRAGIARNPLHAAAHVHLGEAYRQMGDLARGLTSCDRGLALDPSLANGRLIRGILRRDLKDLDGAIEDLRLALPHFAGVAAIHALLGFALSDRDRNDEAIAILLGACKVDPNMPEVHKTLGDLYQALGRAQEAFDAYQNAIRLKPDFAAAYGNFGRLLLGMGLIPLSVAMSRMAVDLAPGLVEVYCYLGAALHAQGNTEEAASAYRRALAYRPDHVEARTELCALRRHACDWAGLDAEDEAIRATSYRQGRRVTPFAILVSTPSPTENLHCARVYAQTMKPQSGVQLASYRSVREPAERLKIGYLSADFRVHATATLIAELLELHDKTRFEVFGYSLGADDQSAIRHRLVQSFDHFVDLRAFGHEAAARRIQADGIDVLIDMKGYTQDARSEILAHRPASIQVNYLGYPGTMGADFIDYIIVDRIVAPFAHQPFYDEKIVHLPHCYQPNDRKRAVADDVPARSDCGLPDDGFVFCCFNNSYKLTAPVFDIWMRLLHAVPGSVLWLLGPSDELARNLIREAAARGIPPGRLVFAPRLPIDEHLARLGLADLFLDTLPVNAHTTASEALWVGVPVLTCLGDAFIGRVAASLLDAVGLPDMITTSLADYEALALRLARDANAMDRLKTRLASNRLATPLFDTETYARHYEAALLHMAALRNAGRPSEAFAITD